MRKRWIKRVLAVAILTVAFGVMSWFAGALPSSPVIAATAAVLISAAGALLWWTREDLRTPVEAATWYTVRRDDATVPPAMDYRLVRLRRDVRDTVAKSSTQMDAVHPLITALTARRLLDRHGVDLATEPERAEAIMTPELSAYLARPAAPDRRSTPRELDAAVRGVEQL